MKTAVFLALILFAQLPLQAQEKDQAELKEYFLDAEFFFAQEEYADALYDYLELYNNGFKDNANINYRMGICYLNIPGQKEKAIDYLLEAVKNIGSKYKESSLKQKTAPVDAYLFLGNAYRVNNNLDKAIESYNKYKELANSVNEIKYADQQILACNTALRFMSNPLRVRITNLGDSVNGNSSNYKAVVSGDGKSLFYMNELPFYDAIYFSGYTPEGWSSSVNITPQIQSDGDQYVTSVSYDGSQLFLTKEDAFNSDIYVSRRTDNKWSKSIPVAGEGINTKYWESHASISRDGKSLYFTSNRKDGMGDMDIYKTQLQANGQWGLPVNLGSNINTALNEDTPFITENDSTLYFSSQGHDNMGGYDIFKSKLETSGQWSKPENIGYPINTTDDDLFFNPWNNGRIGYISMIREGGYGKEDIYAIQPEADDPLPMVLADFFAKQAKPEPPVIAEVKPAEPAVTPVVPEPAQPAQPAQPTQPTQPLPPPPPPPVTPKEIVLDPVYFAFDNFQLSVAGKNQLDKVARLMQEYPVVRVKLVGHADAKGPAEYNLKLSEKRALTVLEYLTNKGIDKSRLEILGLGEKNFAAINSNPDGSDNPEGRGLNRRVEYEIIGTDNNLIIIRMPAIPEHLQFRE
ncbi:MAG: OmpA family protein [Bacteroidales bacterium]|nr:OmpA family protein [Bacteroidales bacterium]